MFAPSKSFAFAEPQGLFIFLHFIPLHMLGRKPRSTEKDE